MDDRPVLVVAGARPNFMKVAPVLAALQERGAATVLVHTGQHYSEELSDNIFRDLGIGEPAYNLGVGSASHAVQTARVMQQFEPVLHDVRPSWVVVVGDVTPRSHALWSLRSCGTILAAGSHTWRLASGVMTGACPRRSTASLPTGCATCC